MPIILGGPFLSHNWVTVDHKLGSCISKVSNFDLLLNAPVPSLLPLATAASPLVSIPFY